MLQNESRFHISDALYFKKCTKILPNFKDINGNGYHIKPMNEGSKICLYMTSIVYSWKLIIEKPSNFSFGLYHTTIKPIKSDVVANQKFNDPKTFIL